MAEAPGGMITVEVAYALPAAPTVITLQVPAGTTAAQALALSGITRKHPEINLAAAAFGIFGQRRPGNTELRDRDRVEIYRPLGADPKEARRRRAIHKGRTPRLRTPR